MHMSPEIKYIHSPDVSDLNNYRPLDPTNFGVLIQVMAGPMGSQGEESFDIMVCSPHWLDELARKEKFIVGRHYLITRSFNYGEIQSFLRQMFARCEGKDWPEVAAKLSRIGMWEFEDYREK